MKMINLLALGTIFLSSSVLANEVVSMRFESDVPNTCEANIISGAG